MAGTKPSKNPLIYSKLDNDADILTPAIGTGSIVGTLTYSSSPVKWNPGMNNAGGNFPQLSSGKSFSRKALTLSWHMIPGYSSGGYEYMWGTPDETFYIYHYSNGNLYIDGTEFSYYANAGFSSGVECHMAIVFDDSAGDDHRVKIYKDAVDLNAVQRWDGEISDDAKTMIRYGGIAGATSYSAVESIMLFDGVLTPANIAWLKDNAWKKKSNPIIISW